MGGEREPWTFSPVVKEAVLILLPAIGLQRLSEASVVISKYNGEAVSQLA